MVMVWEIPVIHLRVADHSLSNMMLKGAVEHRSLTNEPALELLK